MEGGTSDSTYLLPQIQMFLHTVLSDIERGGQASVSIPVFKPREYPLETNKKCLTIFEETNTFEEISCSSEGGSQRLVAMLKVLQIVEVLLQQNRHATKRDVYYNDTALLKGRLDQSINDICCFFHCSRPSLNLVSSSKGLVTGQLSYYEEGRLINCSKRSSTSNGLPVPVHINKVSHLSSSAEYILLVEKETVFQRLANDKFCAKNCCILLTGKGYPDVATRSFLRRLVDQLHLPVYGLMDGDPYGLDILSIYRFGSLTMAYDAKVLAVPSILWLGIFLSDLGHFGLTENCLLPMSKRDEKKADAILNKSYIQQLAPAWWSKLAEFRTRRVKLEVEAISTVSFTSLADHYIPSKIRGQCYI
ncbi:meiotic recombination protein SPO11-1 [Physcomitrium patens]|uniref:DNA topoisomerase (ATP-hydrolyzing) n=2 Tax=Physcomitrium patens TaxID=3218 RepID=A0A024AGV9_PHYPA|nr:meiotic recombination protein SPO11-1-like [Physcomitrium patens]AHY99545.1 meiotic recombination protein [Physcomitrium patens]PNR52760.1 hypothetical protein PHYPA_009135 [Physcomitrium patens]|eukprot:XP_024377836.1 meiotic recombination protein SPO11-1-like [Physcomitrella patens]